MIKRITLTAVLLAAILLLSGTTVFAAYTGESDFGKAIMGMDHNTARQMFGVGESGEDAPSAGLFPICGKGSDGKAYMIAVDADGKLQVSTSGESGGVTIVGAGFSGALGTAAPTQGVMITGKDALGNAQAFYVKSDGTVYIEGVVTSLTGVETSGTTGSEVPAKGTLIQGSDGTNARNIKTDSDGELQIDVLTLPSITGTVDVGTVTTLPNVELSGAPFSGATGTTSPTEALLLGADNEGSLTALKIDGNQELYIRQGETPFYVRGVQSVTFTEAECSTACADTGTTDKTALVTPASGKAIRIHRLTVSTQNAALVKIYQGSTVIWQAYLPANGFAEAFVPGLPISGAADAAISVEAGAVNVTTNLQYQEYTP